MDAVYHPRTDRLYLTNIDKNQLEVFNLADSSFKTAVNVGSRPWGIAVWPRDHNGQIGDTDDVRQPAQVCRRLAEREPDA